MCTPLLLILQRLSPRSATDEEGFDLRYGPERFTVGLTDVSHVCILQCSVCMVAVHTSTFLRRLFCGREVPAGALPARRSHIVATLFPTK